MHFCNMQLAYSYKADALDEYMQMAQDTGYQCLDAFCKCVIHLYQQEYLRRPTEADIELLTTKHEQVHGFPGMLGSIDCMHWGGGTVRWHGKGIFQVPDGPKTTKFKRYQEAARKDVERAFGVLQGRWQIVEQQARAYNVNKIKRIMLCCVILHNMIVEDNGRAITEFEEELIANTVLPTRTWDERCSTQLRMYREVRDRRTHHGLRNALVKHV
uniref:uncharacterized protein LOC122610890 n=1 Tax=Erigeron canadensis TaxID=72917 RepID=UPI001CB8EEA0|nr:uncharacterized protein LOC122610890 [Erigeron canadensis]